MKHLHTISAQRASGLLPISDFYFRVSRLTGDLLSFLKWSQAPLPDFGDDDDDDGGGGVPGPGLIQRG